MQILPDSLQKEQDALAECYFNHDVKEATLHEYIMSHGSRKLVAFIEAYSKEKDAAYKNGIIIN